MHAEGCSTYFLGHHIPIRVSTYHTWRFFELQRRAASLPGPVRLRATFCQREVYGNPTYELKLFVDGVLTWHNTQLATGSPLSPAVMLDTMMGELLWDVLVVGLRLNKDATIQLGQDQGSPRAVIPASAAILNELLP